jgi:hypothetical protein
MPAVVQDDALRIVPGYYNLSFQKVDSLRLSVQKAQSEHGACGFSNSKTHSPYIPVQSY